VNSSNFKEVCIKKKVNVMIFRFSLHSKKMNSLVKKTGIDLDFPIMDSGIFKCLFQQESQKISLHISSAEVERLFSIATENFKDTKQNLSPESKLANVLFRYNTFLKI
jgi:uncharacterized protein YegL